MERNVFVIARSERSERRGDPLGIASSRSRGTRNDGKGLGLYQQSLDLGISDYA